MIMKVVGISAAIWIAISPVAIAQQGGYPASPSHGVVGSPKPDGSVRHGKEPGSDATSNSDTVGRNGRDTRDGHGVEPPSDPANNASNERPNRVGNADRHWST
jgi:hypothetical protein